MRDRLLVSISGRRRRRRSQACNTGLGVLDAGIDGGRRVVGDKLLSRRHGAGRSTIVCVAGRSTLRVLAVHGKAGVGRIITGWRRVGRIAVGRGEVVIIWRVGGLVLRQSAGAVLASCETKLEAGTHQIHKNMRPLERREVGERGTRNTGTRVGEERNAGVSAIECGDRGAQVRYSAGLEEQGVRDGEIGIR